MLGRLLRRQDPQPPASYGARGHGAPCLRPACRVHRQHHPHAPDRSRHGPPFPPGHRPGPDPVRVVAGAAGRDAASRLVGAPTDHRDRIPAPGVHRSGRRQCRGSPGWRRAVPGRGHRRHGRPGVGGAAAASPSAHAPPDRPGAGTGRAARGRPAGVVRRRADRAAEPGDDRLPRPEPAPVRHGVARPDRPRSGHRRGAAHRPRVIWSGGWPAAASAPGWPGSRSARARPGCCPSSASGSRPPQPGPSTDAPTRTDPLRELRRRSYTARHGFGVAPRDPRGLGVATARQAPGRRGRWTRRPRVPHLPGRGDRGRRLVDRAGRPAPCGRRRRDRLPTRRCR